MPDDSIVIGYVNAYAVTRHFGGPEEGGWWYNAGRSLASIPVRVEWKQVVADEEGDGPRSRIFHEQDCQLAEAWLKEQLNSVAYGNIYSARSGQALELRRETVIAYDWPRTRPHYE